MTMQSAKNVSVAFKVEGTFNTAPGDTGAEYLRYTPSPGLTLKAATIRSNEQRSDALQTMGRNGSLQVDGSYGGEMSVGSHDTLLQAAMRGTWTAAVVITEATSGGPTEITTTTSTIVGNTGDWRTVGVREGDVIRLTNHSSAGNNSLNLRVLTVTATVITLIGAPLILNAVADTAFTLTITKKLKNPATPTKRSFRFEQRNVDIDGSQIYGGVRITGFKITGTPDGQAQIEFTALGASMDTLTGASSPYFTTPTTYTSDPLTFADAAIGINGTDIAIGTAFELTYAINAATQPVIGSQFSPDVFDNDASLSGSFSMIREDFDNVTAFVAETEFRLDILLTEPDAAAPIDFISIHVPRIKFTDATAPLGGDGAMIETLPFQCGAQAATTSKDATLLTFCTSAA